MGAAVAHVKNVFMQKTNPLSSQLTADCNQRNTITPFIKKSVVVFFIIRDVLNIFKALKTPFTLHKSGFVNICNHPHLNANIIKAWSSRQMLFFQEHKPNSPWLIKAAGPSQSWAQRFRVEYITLKSLTPALSTALSAGLSSAMHPSSTSTLSPANLRSSNPHAAYQQPKMQQRG